MTICSRMGGPAQVSGPWPGFAGPAAGRKRGRRSVSLAEARRYMSQSAPRAPAGSSDRQRSRPPPIRRRRKPIVRRRGQSVRGVRRGDEPRRGRRARQSDGARRSWRPPIHRRCAAAPAADPCAIAGRRPEMQSRLLLLLCPAGRIRRRGEEHGADRCAQSRGIADGRRGAGRTPQSGVSRRRAAGQSQGVAGGDSASRRTGARPRGEGHILDHNQRHAADRRRWAFLRGSRVRRHGQHRWPEGRPRRAASLQRRRRQFRISCGGSRRCWPLKDACRSPLA